VNTREWNCELQSDAEHLQEQFRILRDVGQRLIDSIYESPLHQQ